MRYVSSQPYNVYFIWKVEGRTVLFCIESVGSKDFVLSEFEFENFRFDGIYLNVSALYNFITINPFISR
jgi:hypothetical protein